MEQQNNQHKKKKNTIVDVANLAGVSISTVSRVLNGTATVMPETQVRVAEAIEALKFSPKAAARALAGRKTMTLGLLISEISGDFFLPMLRGIERASRAAGYELLIQTTDDRLGERPKRSLVENSTDGLLLFAHSVDDEAITKFAEAGQAIVLLYRDAPAGISVPSVCIENEGGAAAAIEHLIRAHGKRRIACLTGPASNHDAIARERGYRRALAAAGLPFDPSLLAPGNFSATVASESIRRLLAQGVGFDAVFAGDDGAAMGVLAALKEAGRRVPEDISVIGFDDQAIALHSQPSLATVRAPTEEVGEEAVRLLIRSIAGEENLASVVLPTAFLPRASCGCAQVDLGSADEPCHIASAKNGTKEGGTA